MTNEKAEAIIQSILTGMGRLTNREIHETFDDQLEEIDSLVWNIVEETS